MAPTITRDRVTQVNSLICWSAWIETRLIVAPKLFFKKRYLINKKSLPTVKVTAIRGGYTTHQQTSINLMGSYRFKEFDGQISVGEGFGSAKPVQAFVTFTIQIGIRILAIETAARVKC
ncbi:hypothetical protein [Oscillatoria sp. FACHB-1407]|uniref:hypothetical protein n=2 Tax=Oscillatoria sp. FACHB-1407 TaxID=2692847 RepID=UPI001685D331|nr:hypothetical protein [Oscillatoria sp. FACHB-1407]